MGFSEWYTQCTDINEVEAMFWFVDGAAAAAVALVDSGASHSFVSAELVSRFSLPVKPGGDMEVTLADGSQVEASLRCCVPLVVCSGDY